MNCLKHSKNNFDLSLEKYYLIDKIFMCVCKNVCLKLVKFLLENGTNIHAKNDYALRWTCVNGHLDVAKFLVKNGTNPC